MLSYIVNKFKKTRNVRYQDYILNEMCDLEPDNLLFTLDT